MRGMGNWADRLLTIMGILWMIANRAAGRLPIATAVLRDHRRLC